MKESERELSERERQSKVDEAILQRDSYRTFCFLVFLTMKYLSCCICGNFFLIKNKIKKQYNFDKKKDSDIAPAFIPIKRN